MAKKTEDKKLKFIKETTEELLTLLKAEAKVEVFEDKENEAVKIELETEEPGILIGYHGETLSSLQVLLGSIFWKEFGQWQRVLVNVGDYRQKREESLRKMALLAAQRVRFSGEPTALPQLPPNERRIIHLALAGEKDIITESEGEGKFRRVVVKPASQK